MIGLWLCRDLEGHSRLQWLVPLITLLIMAWMVICMIEWMHLCPENSSWLYILETFDSDVTVKCRCWITTSGLWAHLMRSQHVHFDHWQTLHSHGTYPSYDTEVYRWWGRHWCEYSSSTVFHSYWSSIEVLLAHSYDQGSVRAMWPICAPFWASEARHLTWRNCIPLLLDYTSLDPHGCRLGLYPLLW